MSDSDSQNPRQESRGTDRAIRRWQDRILVWIGGALVGVLLWIGKGLDASVTELKNSRISTETRLTLVEKETSELKSWLLRIEGKLDDAIKVRKGN